MNLSGKRVLITGGSSGIGQAMARAMAEHGASVVITGRVEHRLAAAASVQARIEGIVCDVTSDDDVRSLRDRLIADGGIDVLVNNAGVMHFFGIAEGFPLAKQLQEVDIDVNGPIRLVDAFLPSLLNRPSIIVNVSSGLAWVPYAPAPVYSGAKAFVHAWTIALRTQLEGTSVRVIELLPPVVDTPLADGLNPSFKRMDPDELVKALLRGIGQEKNEIAPGRSRQLKWLSRLAPRLIFEQLNKGVVTNHG